MFSALFFDRISQHVEEIKFTSPWFLNQWLKENKNNKNIEIIYYDTVE